MKKLNITKKQFGESKYFTNKYGTLKYVSENGKFYRTSKGQVLKFLKESSTITYINEVKFRNKLEDVFTSAISDLDDDNRKLYAEDLLDEYIDGVVEDTHKSMSEYLHSRSTSMNGNFADAELNYRRDFNGADFRDVVEKIDNGMEDSETKQFRDWLVDWYFKAFGTYNLKYNFMEFVSEYTADYEDDTYDESSSVECDRCGKEVHDDDVEIVGDEVLCSRCREKRFWNETLGGGKIAQLIKISGMNEEVIDEKPVDDEMEAAEMYVNYVADHEEDDSFQYDELINSPNAQDEIIHIGEVIHKRGEYENEFLDGGYILQVKMIDEMDESWLGDKLGAAGRVVGKAAGDVVSGAGKLAWKGAKTVGKAAGKGAMAVGKAAGKGAMKAGKAAGKAVGAVATATGKAAVKAGKKVIDKVKGNNSGDLKKGDDVVIQNKDGTKVVGTVLGYDKVDKIYSVQDNEENEPSGDTNKKNSEMNNKEDKDLTKNKDTGTLNKQKKQAAESRIIKIKHVETIVFNESSQYDEGLRIPFLLVGRR